jgi:hypothetical protein
MTREDRLRDVLQLCGSFARNLAYYRVGWSEEHKHLLSFDNDDFWRAVNSNCLDISVLDWCKLFADKKGEYYWKNIVTDAVSFKAGLLLHLGLNEEAFNQQVNSIREYRDKWVAHWDLNRVPVAPVLEVPKKAVWFYQPYISKHELVGVAWDINSAYEHFECEANVVYRTGAWSQSRRKSGV